MSTTLHPCFISVERDVSGNALELALSIARGIGATRGGATLSSAREEAALDLFSEQAIWPVIMVAFRTAYEVLHRLDLAMRPSSMKCTSPRNLLKSSSA